MDEKKNQRKKVLILVLVLGLVLLTIGGTYAFFTYARQGQKINTLTTGAMYFVYDELPNQEGNQISISNAFPVTDEEGMSQDKPGMFEFEVRSRTQGADINYEVYLSKGTNSTGLEELPEKVIRTYLTEVENKGMDTESEKAIQNHWTSKEINNYSRLWYSQVPPVKEDLSGRTLLQDTVPDSPNEYKKTFRYRMWLGDNAEGVDFEGNWIYGNKSFTVKVNVYATNEELSDPIPPVNYIKSWATKECYDDDDNGSYDDSECWSSQLETDFHAPEYKEKITSISFSNTPTIQEEAIKEWDVSDEEDGSIKACLLDDGKGTGTYKVVIATDGVVYANPDSSEVFDGFESLEELNFDNYDTSYVTKMDYMLSYLGLETIDVSSLKTDRVTSMEGVFYDNGSLTSITGLDKWNTSNVTDMLGMFENCSQLQSLDLSSWDTSKVTEMLGMFNSCSQLTILDLSGWDTRSVISMGAAFDSSNAANQSMFGHCENLKQIIGIDSWDVSSLKYLGYMFWNCSQLTDLDLSSWDTANVTYMGNMFGSCSQLSSVGDLSSWDTSSVTDMSWMFVFCSKLNTTITIRGKVTTYWSVFSAAATTEGASITVNYVDDATKAIAQAIVDEADNPNVHLGEKVA